ncbi:MAG: MBOAT family O-acyltransferase [Bacteroidota bacterium]|jgi:alginate O-acetyltransferase complex protein AlgI
MLFNSLVFLFLFLPFTLLGFILLFPKLKKPFLLFASLVFYAWGGVSFVSVLIGSILINYFCGIMIGRTSEKGSRKTWYILGIILNILGLVVFKYLNFLAGNLNILVTAFLMNPLHLETIFLPLGISFFTFKGISYLVTVNRKEALPQRNIINLGLYIGFFPTVIAGPIDRYKAIEPQLSAPRTNLDLFASGVRRFALGLGKKVIIAAPLAEVADRIFMSPASLLSAPIAWLGAITYMLQIYYDFSGYTDMAIGIGRMFGFRFSENFNFPYTSKSIRDFWRRWHITLSTWLRDYVFLPIAYSTSRKLKKENYSGMRVDNLIYSIATIITFFICGFWHGAAWTFIVWGLVFGLLLLFERTGFGRKLEKGPALFSHAYTLFFILAAWVIFRSPDLKYALRFFGLMFGFLDSHAGFGRFLAYINREYILVFILAVAGCTRLFALAREKTENIISQQERPVSSFLFNVYNLLSLLFVLFVLAWSQMSILSHTLQSFIYFRF